MDPLVVAIFAIVYLGMVLGGLPFLAIDRTGIALLGAIALVATGRVSPDDAWRAIDVPTIALLLGLMVVSAQFRLGGAYSAITQRIARIPMSPARLAGVVIAVSAGLSAVLSNDVVCLAMAPLLVAGCVHRGVRPAPMLFALACAANIGSAATLIGNPQNMLIGQSLRLSFAAYLLDGLPVALLGCLALWAILAWQFRSRWHVASSDVDVEAPPINRWQTGKGVFVIGALIVLFLTGVCPRDVAALGAAGVLLLSRRLSSREMLSLIDWQLLVLFAGLFIVNHAMIESGMLAIGMQRVADAGIDMQHAPTLFVTTAALSNLVSNVPAVMLLLPSTTHAQAGAILALASTLAGNLLIVGSIANIIVVDQAGRLGVTINWREHARTGVPVTLTTLAIAGAWLWLRG
ncbi:MAG: anion transporter [Phycisphaerales bacterium]|nr:anion transporter [Phycisphaerales bacterium]MCB9862648.1 anion transporter [Phycisphaerales bacterium]